MATTQAPIPPDDLNRFRITFSDRELKPITRRLHRLAVLDAYPDATPKAKVSPAAAAAAAAAEGDAKEETPDPLVVKQEEAYERDLAYIDIDKWLLSVQRTVASAGNLERQKGSYERKLAETTARTENFRETLAAERAQLVKSLAERDRRVRCDEVAKKILARGKTRGELETQISELQSQISAHRATFDEHLAIAQARADVFARISSLVDECRAFKLPEVVMDEDPEPATSTSVSASASASASASGTAGQSSTNAANARLSAQTLPFQPGPGRASTSSPAPHAYSSSHSQHAHGHSSYYGPSSHSVPHSRAGSGRYSSPRLPASQPTRPSGLRSVTRPGNGLEDGEVGDEEDGEVPEAGAAGTGASASTSAAAGAGNGAGSGSGSGAAATGTSSEDMTAGTKRKADSEAGPPPMRVTRSRAK